MTHHKQIASRLPLAPSCPLPGAVLGTSLHPKPGDTFRFIKPFSPVARCHNPSTNVEALLKDLFWELDLGTRGQGHEGLEQLFGVS